MSSVEQFATVAKSLEETPAPFGEAIGHRIGEEENIRHLIHSPAFAAGRYRCPASLFCVTDKRWLIAVRQKDKSVMVAESAYDTTLLVELTIILLHGQVKIDFVENDEAHSAACQFNTVMQKVYRNAVQDTLRALDENQPRIAAQDWRQSSMLVEWPLKFRNVSILYGPENTALLGGVHWPEVYGGFHRQVAPAAAIVLTDRHLMIVAEEKPTRWFQFRPDTHYGEIISYFPLDRLANFGIHRKSRFCVLELEGQRPHGGERLQIMFPLDKQEEVSRLMEKALSVRRSLCESGS